MARSGALERALDACVEARARDAFVDASRALRRAFARARARERSERANEDENVVDEDVVDADVRAHEDACACALRCGRGLWYESMREDDRRACVDAWFSWEEADEDERAGAGAARACVDAMATTRGATRAGSDDDAIVRSAVTYYVELVRRGVVGRLTRMAAGTTADARAAKETLDVALRAFDRLDQRFDIPVFRSVEAYEAELARQVLNAGEDAPASAAATASRMCRRGAARAVARATLRELAPRVRELGVDAIRAIVEGDEVPASLAWATTMMNEVSDAHAACRWISELFAECDGHESSVNCSWRTLDLVLRVLLRDRYWACEATRFALCETLLLRKGAPRAALPALLRLTILRPIRRGAEVARAKAARDANTLALLDTWSGEGFVREASVELQRTLTSSVRAILAALPSEEWNTMRGNPTQMILKGVSARLDSPSLRPRRHASKVALALSLKMDASKPLRLVDDGDDVEASSDEESEWERTIESIVQDDVFVVCDDDDGGGGGDDEKESIAANVNLTGSSGFQIKVEDPDEVVDMWSLRRDESDSDASDSDDYSDDELVPYDMDSDDDATLRSRDPASLTEARIASLPKPQTLRECIGALRQARSGDASTRQTDIDIADAAEGAVHAVSDIVMRQPHELASCAADLAVTILHAQPPTPDSDPLDRARRQGLASVLTVTPGLAGPTIIDHALSEKCDASQVMDTLSALDMAMTELASPSKAEHLLDASASTRSTARVGIERRFAPKSMEMQAKGATSAPTRSHLIGECFVAPLLRAAAQRLERQSAPEYNPDGLDAMVNGHILYTLGQCAKHAKNATDGPLIGRAVLEFAVTPALADSDQPHLRRSALVAGALVATSLRDTPVAIAYAENSPLSTALEHFTAIAARRHRADCDVDVRAAASFAVAAAADCKARALTALERIADDPIALDDARSSAITTRIPRLDVKL